MKGVSLPVAYMPLVDAAPLIIAQEMGFAEAEGIALDLIAAPSWSSVRDMLAFGRVDAAHLLSPVPVAMALGLGGVTTPISAVSNRRTGFSVGWRLPLEGLMRRDQRWPGTAFQAESPKDSASKELSVDGVKGAGAAAKGR